MKTKIEIHEREAHAKVIIDFPNGNRVYVTAKDSGEIDINSANGSLSIQPHMSNDITLTILS